MSGRDEQPGAWQREFDKLADTLGLPHLENIDTCKPAAPPAARPRPPAPAPAPASRELRLARARDVQRAKREARAARAADSDRQWERKHGDELERAGWKRSSGIKPASWRAGWACMGDHAGHSSQREYDRLPAAVRGMLRRAMAGRDFRNPRARELVAVTALLYRQSRLTLNKARRRLVVEYISIPTIAAVLHDRTSNRKPSRSTLSHKWHRRGGDLHNGQIGILDALRDVGILHWLQQRQEAEHPTISQYWLLDVGSPYMNAAQREFLTECAREAFALEAASRGPPALG